MKLKCVIFDFDGTLFDSMYLWDTVAESYVRSRGKEPKPTVREEVRALSLLQAAEHLKNHALPPCPLEVRAGANVGHVIPQRISGSRDFTLSLRVSRPMKAVTLTVTQDGREVLRRRLPKALPAEMLQLPIRAAVLEQSGDLEVSVQ